MRKYVVIPDSFKGCLSSGEICGIIAREIRRRDPEAGCVPSRWLTAARVRWMPSLGLWAAKK